MVCVSREINIRDFEPYGHFNVINAAAMRVAGLYFKTKNCRKGSYVFMSTIDLWIDKLMDFAQKQDHNS